MGYQVKADPRSEEQGSVDWDKWHEHVTTQLKCEKAKTRKGTIVGIYHFGKQAQPPTEYLLDPSNEIQSNNLANSEKTGSRVVRKETFYDNGKTLKDVDVVVTPVKDWESFSYVVEFSKFQVNKGEFFEGIEEGEKPFQILLAHPWFFEGKLDDRNVVTYQRLPTKKNFKDAQGRWSYKNTNNIYKMALAAELIEAGDPFHYDQRGDLLGKTFQFSLQVGKNKGGYFNTAIKYVGGLSEDDEAPVVDPDDIFGLDFDSPNPPEAIKALHPQADRVLLNTLRTAVNFEGSKIQADLLEHGVISINAGAPESTPPEQGAEEAVKSSVSHPTEPDDNSQEGAASGGGGVNDFDSDIPF